MKKLGLVVLLSLVSAVCVAGGFRPPAVPLVSCDPFFSVWSPANRLTDTETAHWTGARQPISILLTADGKTWRLCGRAPENVPALPQTDLAVRATQTVYTFKEGDLAVTLTWSTAKLGDDLDVFSRPVTYVTARVNGAKEWSIASTIAPELATQENGFKMLTTRGTIAGMPSVRIGRESQTPLSSSGDRVRCNWGWAWLVGPGMVSANEAQLLLAYDDVESINFFGDHLPAWWRRNGMSFEKMLAKSVAERAKILKRLDAFDAEFARDMTQIGGAKYADIAALAYRQTFAACKLVADRNNQPLYFSKENGSNGCIGTVDILYPQAPQMLLMSPTLMRAMLAPVLVYAAHPRWPWPFAPHDLGQFPLATHQRYAGGETARDATRLMPVEECGNMIIALGALAHIEGNADFASAWWPTVTKWVQYLEKFGFDPGNQLCTDDFAGRLAHNANLAAKSIVAFACYARLAEMRGEKDVAAKYAKLAKDLVPKWMAAAKGGRHGGYRLAYDRADTWSMKYNIAWDRILGLNLFPVEVAEAEWGTYQKVVAKYGIPLDSRKAWTKGDWMMWVATLRGKRADVECVSEYLWKFANESPDRVPFSDWFWTNSGRHQSFIARSVIGGLFMPVLTDGAMWKKYAGRDKAKTHLYAPLKGKDSSARALAPEGRDPASAEWKYTTTEPPVGWEQPGFDDSKWLSGKGGFGTGGPNMSSRTRWNTKSIWLRRHVTLAEKPAATPFLTLHHDEDAWMWVNGVPAGEWKGFSADYQRQELAPAAIAALKPGENVIATKVVQTIGGQYLDWGLWTKSDADAFTLATFNIRCPADKGEIAWSNRLPRVLSIIKKHQFDIFGIQEGTPIQRKGLDQGLGVDWARIGIGRSTNDLGEAMCIYYKKDRFECLASDTFWLSETPREPGSKSWDAACPRVCTWGIFKDRKTGKTFRYFNTHLDHISAHARVMGMKALLKEMERIAQGETVFLTGDMNDMFERLPKNEQKRLRAQNGPQISEKVTIEHPIYTASQVLRDSLFFTETPHQGSNATFNGYHETPKLGRIDYVFTTGNVRVLSHATINDMPDGKFPSDHWPVSVRVQIR